MTSALFGAPRERPRRHRAQAFRIRRFCAAYLEHGNGARAAREAGYSVKRAAVTASELLNSPAVIARLADLKRAGSTNGVTPQTL